MLSNTKKKKREGPRVSCTPSIMSTTLTVLHEFMHVEPEWFSPELLLSSSLPGIEWRGDREEGLKAKN